MTKPSDHSDLIIIGRAEKVSFPELSTKRVSAKIDTGADSSSIWAHVTELDGEDLKVIFFGPDNSYYDGREHVFKPGEFEITRVANSFGHRELRYKVKLRIKIGGKTIRGAFTLANRENKLYPVLIGRALLAKKFLVDVSIGSPLRRAERERINKLHEELIDIKEVTK